MFDRLTASIDFHAQALQLRSERQRLIASNIANADTPGYVARDFDFAAALRGAAQSMGGAAGRADSNELGAPIARAVSAGSAGFQPTLRFAAPAQTNLDNNSVDMDRERASFADNAVRYEATLRFINGSLRTMQDAIKSHNQG